MNGTNNDEAVTAWLQAAGRVPLLTPAEELHLGAIIRAWQDHPDGAAAAPPAVIRRGRRARDRMVAANLRLVMAVVSKSGHRLERADALQEGAIGLQRAAEKFDPARGYKFSTYAYWWIRQAVARGGEIYGRTIRLPCHVSQKLAQIDGRKRQLEITLGRAPSLAELAKEVDLPPAELELLLVRGMGVASLDVAIGDGENHIVDAIPSPSAEIDPDRSDLLERLERLERAWPRLARMLRAYYGIGQPAETMKEIAAGEGCSRQRINDLLRRGERLLRLNRVAPEVPHDQLTLVPMPDPAAAPPPIAGDDPAAR